jgi:hypothetical protein
MASVLGNGIRGSNLHATERWFLDVKCNWHFGAKLKVT